VALTDCALNFLLLDDVVELALVEVEKEPAVLVRAARVNANAWMVQKIESPEARGHPPDGRLYATPARVKNLVNAKEPEPFSGTPEGIRDELWGKRKSPANRNGKSRVAGKLLAPIQLLLARLLSLNFQPKAKFRHPKVGQVATGRKLVSFPFVLPFGTD
jgi:hypothetical protein